MLSLLGAEPYNKFLCVKQCQTRAQHNQYRIITQFPSFPSSTQWKTESMRDGWVKSIFCVDGLDGAFRTKLNWNFQFALVGINPQCQVAVYINFSSDLRTTNNCWYWYTNTTAFQSGWFVLDLGLKENLRKTLVLKELAYPSNSQVNVNTMSKIFEE